MNDSMNRATGLLVIEVRNSNPNGDPDRESDPRTRSDRRGEISPVSFKRKIRDLVEWKDGPVWAEIGGKRDAGNFDVLESNTRDWSKVKLLENEEKLARFWDARVFGATFLEKKEEGNSAIRTGVVQFGLGVSVAPVTIKRLTTTKKASAQEEKDRGMAPLGFRVVEHGVYCMPFFVNPTAARRTNATREDIDLLLRLIPHAYAHTASYVRSEVEIRHAWFMEHKSPLGSCSDFAILDALQPRVKDGCASPARMADYEVPATLPQHLREKLSDFRDLIAW